MVNPLFQQRTLELAQYVVLAPNDRIIYTSALSELISPGKPLKFLAVAAADQLPVEEYERIFEDRVEAVGSYIKSLLKGNADLAAAHKFVQASTEPFPAWAQERIDRLVSSVSDKVGLQYASPKMYLNWCLNDPYKYTLMTATQKMRQLSISHVTTGFSLAGLRDVAGLTHNLVFYARHD
jgi:hypothetical protein